jgi:hypothetical protein
MTKFTYPEYPKMNCQVSFTLPDGRHMRHTGRYPTPYAAMQAVEAQVPGAVANAGIALAKPSIVWRRPAEAAAAPMATATAIAATTAAPGRSCDELGVCQHPTKTCLAHTICPRVRKAHYFAPGTIDGGGSALQPGDSDVAGLRWSDWLGALGMVAVAFALAGWLV